MRKGKKGNNIFVRWGGLNLRNKLPKKVTFTKGTYHSPPVNRGFYAFPIKAIETFLAGHRLKEGRKEFKYEGLIWHHLEKHTTGTILQRSGHWVLTEFSVWETAFLKYSLNDRYGEDFFGKSNRGAKSINEPGRSRVSGWYSKDHYEVFIPEKI